MYCEKGHVTAMDCNDGNRMATTECIDLTETKKHLGNIPTPISPLTGKPMVLEGSVVGIDKKGNYEIKSLLYRDSVTFKSYRYDAYDKNGVKKGDFKTQMESDRIEITRELERKRMEAPAVAKGVEIVEPPPAARTEEIEEPPVHIENQRVRFYSYMKYDSPGQEQYLGDGGKNIPCKELPPQLRDVEAYGPRCNELDYDGAIIHENAEGKQTISTVFYRDPATNERYRFDKYQKNENGKWVSNRVDVVDQIKSDNAHPEKTLTPMRTKTNDKTKDQGREL